MKCTLLILFAAIAAGPLHAQPVVRIGGFLDAYYAYDLDEPSGRGRAFTTQPSRHNEFNVNLAMLRASASGERLRGALALGTGTYVEANYAAEPELLRNIIEAWGGVELTPGLWLDAGVLPSHIGPESVVSAQNLALSRSLMADYSPFFETGVRLSYAPTDRISLAALVLNGWQNIRETNGRKAVGTQIQVKPSERLLLNWSTYIGDERPDGAHDAYLRLFSDAYAQADLSERLTLLAAVDVGRQGRPGGDARWIGAALTGRYALTARVALTGRVELFNDPRQAIVATGTAASFQTTGASAGVDFAPADRVLLRFEARGFRSENAVWPSRGQGLRTGDAFVYASLALTL